MSKVVARAFAVSVVLAVSACVSGSASGGRGAGNVLTNADLVATNEVDPYMAVQRLRPRWLRARGQTSGLGTTVVTLFVDGTPRGDASNLRTLNIVNIEDITYLSASEATFQFGTLAGSGGTLAVRTRR